MVQKQIRLNIMLKKVSMLGLRKKTIGVQNRACSKDKTREYNRMVPTSIPTNQTFAKGTKTSKLVKTILLPVTTLLDVTTRNSYSISFQINQSTNQCYFLSAIKYVAYTNMSCCGYGLPSVWLILRDQNHQNLDHIWPNFHQTSQPG